MKNQDNRWRKNKKERFVRILERLWQKFKEPGMERSAIPGSLLFAYYKVS